MNIEHKITGDELVVGLIGHINSGNAAEAEALINEAIGTAPGAKLILDAQKLEYIASVGLRIILRLKKAHKELKIINVSNDVYEVFDMTGFTEMMDIQKAYRELSVEGCEAIGQGSNGVVYRLDPETVVKVYRDKNSLPLIERERELARKAFVMGIPTAISYDVAKVGDTYGSVFELLNAKSYSKILAEEPEREDEVVGMFVDILRNMHGTMMKPGEIPEMKETAVNWAKDLKGHIPAQQHEKLMKMLDEVPDSMNLLHGDYHFKNVMIQNGESLIIDMDTLCTGNPVFEFGSIFNAYVGFGESRPDNVTGFLGLPYDKTQIIWKKILQAYFETDDAAVLEDKENKAKVIGYTRLLRRAIRRESDKTDIINTYRAELIEAIDKVQSLAY